MQHTAQQTADIVGDFVFWWVQMKCVLRILAVLLSVILLVSGCSKGDIKPVDTDIINQVQTPVVIEKTGTELGSLLFHTDSKLYFAEISEDSYVITCYNLVDNQINVVGKIKNFLMSNNSNTQVNGKIYFFVTTSSLLGKKNCFYCIDIATDTLEKIYDEGLYQSFNYLTTVNGKVYSTKGNKIGNKVISYIEEYNVETRKRKTVKKVTANHNKKTGEIILNIASDESNFYVYSQKYENYVLQHYCDVYDNRFNLLQSKKFDKQENNSIFNTIIGRLEVKDNKIYIQNFSNYVMLCDMEGNNKSIYNDTENQLWLSYRFSEKQPWILYYSGQSDIYSINSDCELEKSEKFKIDEGYEVNMVTQYEESVVIDIRKTENYADKKLIYYKYTDLF